MKKIAFLSLIAATMLFSCKDKVKIDTSYEDGVQQGENVTINQEEVKGTVNVEGGSLTIEGNTEVNSDINIDAETGGVLYITDNVTIHKINMDNGLVYISGSPIISTDFNLNNGTVYIGNNDSEITDTVKVLSQMNIRDTLIVRGGVLYVDSNINLTSGVISVENNAKIIITHDFNQGADVYGIHNIDANNLNHNGGERNADPLEL